ncbi:baseplate wedge tail fiber protein connector [Escherichia phage vB_EcoM_005]|uniref:Baseplate wedge tail fiber n=1 Tax=Escherichia phage vB_EcoM_005 TaxID=2500761 RepID=A0A3T0ILQ9_9CAUD|nr:baseplate wedge tail fiber protein connector [Escherichia phage vB_EcoM_005]AZV00961.1 baseplate wedge tail fiber [Escherichia phage vB_EcoM_005]
MIKQTGKELIDVGEIGNASTGDILYDGGVKLNTDLNNIYNTFGDQRKTALTGELTGQKLLLTTVKGAVGEGIEIINSNGSISSTNYLEIRILDTFASHSTSTLRIVTPYTRVLLWCVSDTNGVAVWDYSIESMFGDKRVPLNKTYNISSVARDIPVVYSGQYSLVKLLVTAVNANETIYKASEYLVFIDNQARKIYSTEYAVIKRGQTSDDDEIYSLDFKFDTSNYIIATASSVNPMRLAIKVVETQTIGVPV